MQGFQVIRRQFSGNGGQLPPNETVAVCEEPEADYREHAFYQLAWYVFKGE